jgi:DNA-binding response OmpR family regulator
MNSTELVQKMEVPSFLMAPVQVKRKPQTVLLVEDEDFLLEITSDVLESAGFPVLKARDAKEAWVLFRRHQRAIDLLLSDVVLPDRNGFDMAKEMRRNEPSLEVVLISGYMWNEIASSELSGMGISYMPKPFSAGDLLSKVNQVLRTSEVCI